MSEAGTAAAFKFCQTCGHRIAFTAVACPRCGARDRDAAVEDQEISPKSFTIAIILANLSGLMGLHHFYLGNIVHGALDLSLFVITVILFVLSHVPGLESLFALAILTLIIDALHSLFVISMLIIGKQRDGKGRLVAYPGQF